MNRGRLNGRLRWDRLGRTGPLLPAGGGQGGLPIAGQQGQQQNQGQGNQGGQGQQQDLYAGLFDDITGTGNAGGDQNQGQQGGQQGQQQGGTPLTVETLQAMLAQQAQATQAEIDRRINGAVNTLGNRVRNRGRQGQQGGGQQNQQQGNQGQQGGQNQQGGQQDQWQQPLGLDQNGVPQLDLDQFETSMTQREATAAFREYLGDDLKTVSVEEKHFAIMVGRQMLARTPHIDDPDRAGLEVAKQVATQVRSLRDSYRKATIEALRRRGLLKEDLPVGGLTSTAITAAPGATSGPAALPASLPGAGGHHIVAAQNMAAQYNRKAGHPAPAATGAATQ